MTKTTVRGWLGAVAVGVLALSGAATATNYGGDASQGRRLAEGYRALMSPAEEKAYLAESSLERRLAMAEAAGLRERFERLPPEHRAAVLEREIRDGMSTDAVLLSWGPPERRSRLNDGHEEWFYSFATSMHLDPGMRYSLFITPQGTLDGYHADMLDAPSVPSRP